MSVVDSQKEWIPIIWCQSSVEIFLLSGFCIREPNRNLIYNGIRRFIILTFLVNLWVNIQLFVFKTWSSLVEKVFLLQIILSILRDFHIFDTKNVGYFCSSNVSNELFWMCCLLFSEGGNVFSAKKMQILLICMVNKWQFCGGFFICIFDYKYEMCFTKNIKMVLSLK